MSNNYYDAMYGGGAFLGAVQLQASGEIGGYRNVFVGIDGINNNLAHFPFGAQLANPFKGAAKAYAGDLGEMRYNDKGEEPKYYLLKTYKVKSMSTTTVKIYRDGYSHIPFVGDILMKAPDTLGANGGKAYTVTAVVAEEDAGTKVWTLTFNTEIDAVVDGDVLVEAEAEAAADAKMVVKVINSVLPSDYDMPFTPSTGAGTSFTDAKYDIDPVMHGIMYIHRMSPMPKCVLDVNKSRVNGWYEV